MSSSRRVRGAPPWTGKCTSNPHAEEETEGKHRLLRGHDSRGEGAFPSPPFQGDAFFHVGAAHGLSDSEKDGVKMLEKLLGGKAGERIWTYTHVFTHRIWHMKAYLFHGAKEPEGDYRWYSCEEYREIPLAGPHAKLAAYIEPYLEE